MVRFLRVHSYAFGGGLVLFGIAFYGLYSYVTHDPLAGLITTTVERGTVESTVSVSGITKASRAADLGFKSAGTVSKIYVTEGSSVKAGDVLATLGAEELVANRASAVADLRVAEADRAELLSGDTTADRDITSTKVAIAAAELERVTARERVLVENAKRTLRSDSLTAQTADTAENSPAPVISGTYRCEGEGSYVLSVYNSAAPSGYSMRVTGIETGNATVSVDQPAAFGSCGLFAQFTQGAQYSNSVWTILIPNTTAKSYLSNKNSLAATLTTASSSIATANQALTLAKLEATAGNAAPRSEAISRANARIEKATAQIALIDAQIGDRAVIAPFDGIVTRVDIITGETSSTATVFTVLATDTIELTARIPEVDITRVASGQSARVVFDANTSDTFTGSVTYVSPLPIQIEGVAYFEVKIILTNPPAWLRGGLNSDIDIITEATPNVLRVPKRYVTTEGGHTSVRTLSGTTIATTSVTQIAEGNDGYIAIEGVTEGTTVVTP